MQYQKILFLLNITVLGIVYFFCKEKPQKLKLLVSTTLYAYILAIPLPYLLIWIPLKGVLLFYAVAIGLSFFIFDAVISNLEDIKIEKEARKLDSQHQKANEIGDGNTQDTDGLLLSVRKPVLTNGDEKSSGEIDTPIMQMDMMVKADTENEAVISELDAAEHEAAAVLEIDTPTMQMDMMVKADTENETVISELDAAEPEAAAVLEADTPTIQTDMMIKADTENETVISEPDAAEPEAGPVSQPDIPTIQTDMMVKADTKNETVISELDAAEHEAAAVLEIDTPTIQTDMMVKADTENETVINELDAAEPEAGPVSQADIPTIQMDGMVEADTENEAAFSEPDTVSEAIEVTKSNIDESYDIEMLIDKAFDAKCKDDYLLAIMIFEQILKQRPAQAIIQLITEDIEVMYKKIS